MELRFEFVRHFQAGDKASHLVFCNTLQSTEIPNLVIECVVGAVEPITLSCSTMYTERCANRTPKLLRFQLALLWKYLNALG